MVRKIQGNPQKAAQQAFHKGPQPHLFPWTHPVSDWQGSTDKRIMRIIMTFESKRAMGSSQTIMSWVITKGPFPAQRSRYK